MRTDTREAIERVLKRRKARGAKDTNLIGWLNGLKRKHPYGHRVIDEFIDSIEGRLV